MRSAVLFAFVVGFVGVALPVAAGPIDYSAVLKAADFGDLKQADVPGCANIGCGPTAATNSFAFLEQTYPKVYGGKLIRNPGDADRNKDGVVNRYDGLIATALDLAANFMNTCCNKTTLRNDMASGKTKYIETHAKDSTVYEVMDDPDLNKLDFDWKTNVPANYKAARPTPQWLSANLKSGEDIEILLSRDDGKKLTLGHYVTVTQLKWNDADGSGTINGGDGAATLSFVDPAGPNPGTERTETLAQRANGLLYLTNAQGLEADIRFAVKESPKPAPSVPTGASATGSAGKSLSFDAVTGALSLSPFAITAAYIAGGLGPLDTARIDQEFSTDPILGAIVSVSPFFLGQRFDDGQIAFGGYDGVVTISRGADVLLTAFAPTLIFDPFLAVPFYAPLQVLEVNMTAGSPFLAQMQSRLATAGTLPFDLFISPYADFRAATNGFTTSAEVGADGGVAQNGVAEPSACALIGMAVPVALAYRRRRRNLPEAP